MLPDSIKVKFKISDLIDALEKKKQKILKSYDKEITKYEFHIKKIAPKLSSEIRKIADSIDLLDLTDIKNTYNNKVSFECEIKVWSKPSIPNTNQIDSFIDSLKLSSDEYIVIKQTEYDYFF